MFDAVVRHVEKTWTDVFQGNSTLDEKLEFGGEFILGVAALAGCAGVLESTLPKLGITAAQPAIEKTSVFAVEYSDGGLGRLFSRACANGRFIDAGSVESADAMVAQISKATEGRALKEIFILSHGKENAALKLSRSEESSLADLKIQTAFKSLNMTSNSRFTFLGCNMAGGPHGADNLQRFANATGVTTRAFKWTQFPGNEGFGPYVEAVPNYAQQLKGSRVHLDVLHFPAALALGTISLNLVPKTLYKEIVPFFVQAPSSVPTRPILPTALNHP